MPHSFSLCPCHQCACLPRPRTPTLRVNFGNWKGATPAAGGVAAGAASPSAPVVSACRRQTGRQRVFAGQQSESDRDLSSPRDAELLSKRVAVGLCRPGRDAESVPDLFVRQALCDQLDHLPLPRGDAGRISECLHDGRVRSLGSTRYRPKGVSPRQRATGCSTSDSTSEPASATVSPISCSSARAGDSSGRWYSS